MAEVAGEPVPEENLDLQLEPFAVADIGSNTVKMNVYRCRPGAFPAALHHESDTVRIGFGVSETGNIARDRAERLITTLRRMEETARQLGTQRLIAVATEAFRNAANGAMVRDEIAASTGWDIQVISGLDEARFVHLGATPYISVGSPTAIADIGGASTELIVLDADESVTWAQSIPIGSGALFDRHMAASPPPPGSMRAARQAAAKALATITSLPSPTGELLLSGGSGYLLSNLLGLIDPEAELDSFGIRLLHRWLAGHGGDETTRLLDVQLERAHVLPASLCIVEALVHRLTPTTIRAIPSGVGAGLAIDWCNRYDRLCANH